MDEIEKFEKETQERIKALGERDDLADLALNFQCETGKVDYLYNFKWLGLPIIQYPQDIVALQEIIFNVKPDLIIEAGVARGGSIIFSASMLAILDLLDQKCGEVVTPRQVVGIDVDIRSHNRASIEEHPLNEYVTLIEGSSIDPEIVRTVKELAKPYNNILVLLDSNHTHDHVLSELQAYASLTAVGSYTVVYDTVIEKSPVGYHPDRSWNVGNSPLTAVQEFLSNNSDFKIDKSIPNKLLITVAPDGFLKRVN